MTNCYLLSYGFLTAKLSLQRILSLYRVSVYRGLSVKQNAVNSFTTNSTEVAYEVFL